MWRWGNVHLPFLGYEPVRYINLRFTYLLICVYGIPLLSVTYGQGVARRS